MAKCIVCNSKIEYNKYEIIDSNVYCPDCAIEYKKKLKKFVKPTKKAKKAMKNQGITEDIITEESKEFRNINGAGVDEAIDISEDADEE